VVTCTALTVPTRADAHRSAVVISSRGSAKTGRPTASAAQPARLLAGPATLPARLRDAKSTFLSDWIVLPPPPSPTIPGRAPAVRAFCPVFRVQRESYVSCGTAVKSA
jgi:hypothetical protein